MSCIPKPRVRLQELSVMVFHWDSMPNILNMLILGLVCISESTSWLLFHEKLVNHLLKHLNPMIIITLGFVSIGHSTTLILVEALLEHRDHTFVIAPDLICLGKSIPRPWLEWKFISCLLKRLVRTVMITLDFVCLSEPISQTQPHGKLVLVCMNSTIMITLGLEFISESTPPWLHGKLVNRLFKCLNHRSKSKMIGLRRCWSLESPYALILLSQDPKCDDIISVIDSTCALPISSELSRFP